MGKGHATVRRGLEETPLPLIPRLDAQGRAGNALGRGTEESTPTLKALLARLLPDDNSIWLVKLLAEYGCRQTVLIQPEKRANKKTDRRDANVLGELLWTNRHRLLAGKKVQNVRRVRWPSPDDAEDRQLTMLRKRLGTLRTRTLNKIQHILLKHNIQRDCPTKGLQTKKARAWLPTVALPAIDRLEMNQLLAQWDLWDEQLEELEKRIAERQVNNPTAKLIATIPGAGPYSSLALAARIGPIGDFPTADSLANYAGDSPNTNYQKSTGRPLDNAGSFREVPHDVEAKPTRLRSEHNGRSWHFHVSRAATVISWRRPFSDANF